MKKNLFLLTTFLLLSFIGFGQAYCNSNFTDVSYEYITNVSFVGINNPSGGTVGGPVDYTSQIATVSPGSQYSLSVTIEADFDEYVYAFIDWNQNGTLDDAGEVYTVVSGTDLPGPHTINIDVPVTATTGNTRMRVMLAWDGDTPNPCYSATYGEAEDYTVLVLPTGACLPPSNLVVSNITTTTATVDWDASTSNPSIGYAYEVRTSGAAGSGPTGLISSGTESGLSVSLTTMPPNTNLTFYIRAICSVGDSSVWMPKTFRTACVAATLPYIEDFEGATTPAMPPCTSTENAGTGNNWVTINNPGYGFTNKCLYYQYNTSNAANAWFYTNGIPLTAGNSYRLKFDYGSNSTAYNEKLQVMYGSSADYLSMTDQVIDLSSINNNVRKDTFVDFIASTTGEFYFGFNVYSAAFQFNLYVDNIQITVSPTCDAPTNVQVANITTTDADISWDAPLIGAPASYSIYYSTTNTAPSLTTAPTISGISMTTETLTGLTAGTEYYVWVRSICSATDSSAWSNVKTFITPPGCGGNFYDPGGPSADYANNANSTTTIYPDNVGDVVSVAFSSFATENGWDGLMIYDGPDDTYPLISSGSTFNRATCPNGAWTGTTTFSAQGLTFTSTDASGALTFVFTSDGSGIAAGWVAAITCAPPPTCNEPTNIQIANITTTDADISWDAPTLGNSPASYSIYYSTTNTAPSLTDAPTISGISMTTETLTGLTAGTEYYVWVRSICSATDSSAWSSVKTFITPPGCGGNFYDPGGPSADYANNANSTTTIYPDNVGDVVSVTFNSFATENGWDGLMIYDGPDDTYPLISSGSTFNRATCPNGAWTGTTTFSAQGLTFTSTDASGALTFVFTSDGSGIAAGWVAAITCAPPPTCNEPTNIQIANITSSDADISWDAPTLGNSPASYSIYYSTTNTAPSLTGAPTISGVLATTTTLTGLTPASTYYIWVRSVCSATDSSIWSTVKTFTTQCVEVTNFSENFDGITIPALPTCFAKVGTTGLVNTQATGAASTPNCMYIYSTSSSDIAMVSLPAVSNADAGTHRLRFKARANVTVGGILQVGYLTDPADQNTFVQLGTDYITTSTSVYDNFELSPVSAPTGVTVLAIKHTGSPANSILVDDIVYEAIPSCDNPINLLVSGITMTDAQVDWSAPVSGTVTDYSYELRTSGAAGSGATGLVSSGTTATTNVTFNTLSSTTSYTFYVRANCTSPTDSSSYSSASFFTLIENDDCSGAILLTAGIAVNATTIGATQSQPGETCNGFSGTADDDVWFKFEATSNGNATIALTNAASSLDAVIIAYSGICGSLLNIGCADNGLSGGLNETLNLTGLISGETYYFRVYGWGSGATASGAFTITVTGSAVPVTYTNFTGKKEGTSNILSWTTATEINNIGYELERSADGNHFSKLDFIASKAINGNSNIALSYNYNDNKPLLGNNYYRLKQMDKDGKVNYSTVVLLKGDKATQVSITGVYPNPTRNMLNVNIASPSNEKVSIMITDITGKVLVQQSVVLNTGDNLQQLDVSKLSQGTYLIKTICNNGCESAVSRFVKF